MKMKKTVMIWGAVCAGLLSVTSARAEAAEAAKAPKALKVLMIGNSFSVCNVVHMPAIARSMGLKLDLASLYIGGCTLDRHWRNVESNRIDAAYAPYAFDYRIDGVTNANSAVAQGPKIGRQTIGILEALQLADWDVVTLQQGSHLSWQPCSYQPYGDRLVETIRALAPRAEIVVQETWSYTPWDRRFRTWGIDRDTMYAALHAAYAEFAAKYGFRVIPVGTAVQRWRRELPVVYTENSFGGDVVGGRDKPDGDRFRRQEDGRWVPACDVFHLAPGGEYLQSLVWTAELFGVDVTKCAYAPDFLPPEHVALMKKIAMEAVSGLE